MPFRRSREIPLMRRPVREGLQKPRRRPGWLPIALVTAALAGAVLYGYPRFSRPDILRRGAGGLWKQGTAHVDRIVETGLSTPAGVSTAGSTNSEEPEQAWEPIEDIAPPSRRSPQQPKEVASFAGRSRVRFEIRRGRTEEIAPGLLLHLSEIDRRQKSYRGWLQIVGSETRILWLRDQDVLQAFPFDVNYLRHDLVITALDEDAAAGYLIYPPGQQGKPRATGTK